MRLVVLQLCRIVILWLLSGSCAGLKVVVEPENGSEHQMGVCCGFSVKLFSYLLIVDSYVSTYTVVYDDFVYLFILFFQKKWERRKIEEIGSGWIWRVNNNGVRGGVGGGGGGFGGGRGGTPAPSGYLVLAGPQCKRCDEWGERASCVNHDMASRDVTWERTNQSDQRPFPPHHPFSPRRQKGLMAGGHSFTKKTFHKPTYCHHCTDLLWGILQQGSICEGEYRLGRALIGC